MIKRILVLVVILLSVSACVKEAFNKANYTDYQTISFSSRDFSPISITTRSTLGEDAESRILNLYVILFSSTGDNIIYKHHFTKDERHDSFAAMPANEHSWTVNIVDKITTGGTIRMKSPDVSNGKLYIISNINDNLFNISSESLSTIRTENDLLSIVTHYNYTTLTRMGSYIMVGKVEDVNINEGAFVGSYDVPLQRIDSKIEVKVGIIPGATTTRNSITQEILSFEPVSWQVFRLPKSCNLIEGATDAAPTDADNFFDGDRLGFETHSSNVFPHDVTHIDTSRPVHGFSFYMLENRQSAKNSVAAYHSRDKRLKDENGGYAIGANGEIWENAPEYGTYIKITGNVEMSYEEGAASQTLHSLATYYVHLGDFATDLNDYQICRNTKYTYNINIAGVDKIQVEVEKDNELGWDEDNEEQSGATGEVFVSQEDIHIFDAHYGQRVYRFNVAGMIKQSEGDVKNLTWFVNTPFGRKGMPDKVGIDAIDVVTGFDYKWVHFMLNSKEPSYTEPHGGENGAALTVTNPLAPNYCQYNRVWPGEDSPELMNIVEFCDFLRKQIVAYNDDKPHLFDSQGNIYVTVFVDEFYYDVDPTSDESRTALWHEFVNQPMRTMHIMCNSSISADNESSMIKSAVSIRQLAIETIFDTENSLEGWGVESDTEFTGSKYFFSTTDARRVRKGFSSIGEEDYDMTDTHNGLYNSGQMWKLVSGGVYQTQYWNENINYIQTNQDNYLREQILRYACLSRNRDENGNGVIDQDEVKWYTASLGQLQELYIGEFGITRTARLYNLELPEAPSNANGYWNWRNHVISSTTNPNTYPLYVWSEEGISYNEYCEEWLKPALLSVRCVRNLENDTHFDITKKNSTPNSIAQVTENPDGSFTFDFSRLNKHSKRPNVTGELLPQDEKSTMALLSNSFQTGPIVRQENNQVKTYNNNDYISIKNNLEKGISPCPDGFRMPNIREMTIAYLYIQSSNTFWSEKGNTNYYYMVTNYYSFGHSNVGGNGFDALADNNASRPQYTFYFRPNNISLDPTQTYTIRCVKDL